jgi:SAM-dependent methyltransferase
MNGRAHWSDVAHLLVDPIDHSPFTHDAERGVLVGGSGRDYAVVHDQPVLLASDGRTSAGWKFPAVHAGQQADLRPDDLSRRGIVDRLKRRVRGDRDNSAATTHITSFLTDRPVDQRTVLIIGGGTVGAGSERLFDIAHATIVSFDVYPSTNTTFVADGHQLPVASESVDVVWVQAVLEHVAQPSVVVDELTRVLVPGGLVYAETPFLQPVHEGPYDFTRFTHSGHRLLFGHFDQVSAGPIGGPGAMLALALRGLVGGLTRSRRAAKLAYAVAAGLGSLDRAISPEWRTDFATGTHFLGEKNTDRVSEFRAASYYEGAQQ